VAFKEKNINYLIISLKILLGLLLLVSLILLKYEPVWFHRNLPENNFVMMTLTKFVTADCQKGADCTNSFKVILESSASGVVFLQRDTKSYVLTAEHFCNATAAVESSLPYDRIISIIKLQDLKGRTWDSKILYYDSQKDLCLLETSMPIEKNINFAYSMPSHGEKVFAISAPMGLYAKNVSLQFEGLFSGCDENQMCFFTIPAIGGSSGSLVYDKKGNVISMIQMAVHNFHTLSMGVGIHDIREFLNNASDHLQIDLL
tara:strand:+ start:2879 stop:3655 length:777 start_codon:yes stop_codon:yes gene_type:complete